MMGRKESRPLTSVQGSTTLVASDAVVTGDISFSGNLDVEGRVVGSITSAEGKESMLRVMEGGHVEGSIHVPSAMVNGAVKGDIHSAERLELSAKAEVDRRLLGRSCVRGIELADHRERIIRHRGGSWCSKRERSPALRGISRHSVEREPFRNVPGSPPRA